MAAPWMPLYVADYLADTGHLSAAEHGGYLLLIMHYWRQGGLLVDEGHLQRIARMTAAEWRRSRDTIAALFQDGWKPKFAHHFEHSIDRYIEPSVRRSVLADAGGVCSYCGSVSKLEIDHVVAVAAGGSNERSNLAASCRPCNASKGKKSLSDWGGRT